MGEPAYKLEEREDDWVVYIDKGLDRSELCEFLDYLTLQSIRRRSGLTEEDAQMLADEVKRAAWERVRDRFERVHRAGG
ncbi:MAG TPA: hypothetical protein VF092_22590 [Longimicrobium sp.]